MGRFDSDKGQGWLVQTEMVETSKIFVREATLVSPYAILLAGGGWALRCAALAPHPCRPKPRCPWGGTTAVHVTASPHAAWSFAGDLDVQHAAGLVVVDGWARFKVSARIGLLWRELKGAVSGTAAASRQDDGCDPPLLNGCRIINCQCAACAYGSGSHAGCRAPGAAVVRLWLAEMVCVRACPRAGGQAAGCQAGGPRP